MSRTLIYVLTFALGLFISSNTYAGPHGSKHEVRKFRFGQHTALKFERLVIELGNVEHSNHKPTIELKPGKQRGNYQVILHGVALVGAIPEAAINEAFTPRSKFLGPLEFHTEESESGLSIGVSVKKASYKVEALLLQNPTRLVIDAFTINSPRASGPQVLELWRKQKTVMDEGTPESKRKPSAKKQAKLGRKFTEPVFCYRTSAQLEAKVNFTTQSDSKKKAGYTSRRGKRKKKIKSDDVVCFPKSARVVANIGFKTSFGKFAPPPVGDVAAMPGPMAQYPPVDTGPQGFVPPELSAGPGPQGPPMPMDAPPAMGGAPMGPQPPAMGPMGPPPMDGGLGGPPPMQSMPPPGGNLMLGPGGPPPLAGANPPPLGPPPGGAPPGGMFGAPPPGGPQPPPFGGSNLMGPPPGGGFPPPPQGGGFPGATPLGGSFPPPPG